MYIFTSGYPTGRGPSARPILSAGAAHRVHHLIEISRAQVPSSETLLSCRPPRYSPVSTGGGVFGYILCFYEALFGHMTQFICPLSPAYTASLPEYCFIVRERRAEAAGARRGRGKATEGQSCWRRSSGHRAGPPLGHLLQLGPPGCGHWSPAAEWFCR